MQNPAISGMLVIPCSYALNSEKADLSQKKNRDIQQEFSSKEDVMDIWRKRREQMRSPLLIRR